MKLTIEKHPELTRLINFFAEMETIATRMGLHVDDLNSEHVLEPGHLHTSFRQNAKDILKYRVALLTSNHKPEHKESNCCSISSLSIHKED